MKIRYLILTCLFTSAWISNTAAQSDRDFMASQSSEPGLVGGLRAVTLIVSDIEPVRKLYVGAFKLEEQEPVSPSEATLVQQGKHWGMPQGLNWQQFLFKRPNVPAAALLRVLLVPESIPAMRQSWDRREPGPYGIGFATSDTYALDERSRSAGFDRTTPEVSDYSTERPDGSSYRIHEASWFGPAFIRAIGVSRKDGMAPVGPIDSVTGMGGPSYASQILDDLQPMLEFFEQVLDFEIRSQREWTFFDPPFRFAMVHPKGNVPGHVAFVEYEPEHMLPASGIDFRPPNLGMAIWSFETRDLDEVLARAKAHGTTVLGGPVRLDSPALGDIRAVTLLAPNGFLIEVFEAAE